MKTSPYHAFEGMYDYTVLPSFAAFILQHHLEPFNAEQIDLCDKLNAPILQKLSKRFTREEIIDISRDAAVEYLDYLRQNMAKEQIEQSMKKWLSDQLEVVGRSQIAAEDITIINYIRGRALKKYIPLFTSVMDTALSLNAEIDTLLLGSVTTAVENYMGLLRNRINEESNFSQKLMVASPAITFLYDLVSDRDILFTGKVTEVTGYTNDELLSMGNNILTQVTKKEDLKKVRAHIRLLVERNNDQFEQIEYRLKHKDGSFRWLRTYAVIFKRDEKGQPVQLLGKTFEITREKETALALAQRERQLLEAQELAHIGSYEWNIEDNTSNSTPEVKRIFQLENGQRFESFMSNVHPDDVQKVRDAVSASLVTGIYQCEYRYIRNGTEKVIWSIGKVETRNHKPHSMVGTVQDVTEIKRLEKELIQKTTELERLNDSLQQFAYIASHDLKEPIRKISVFTDKILIVEKDRLHESSVYHIKKIQTASRTMLKMVEDILSFSLLTSTEDKGSCKLTDVVAEVTELLDQTIQEKRAKIHYDGLPEAFVIPSQFRQLFQNLISNSLKFSKPDLPPKVVIKHSWLEAASESKTQPGRFLQLHISDNGIGFSNEWSEKIFQLFQRLHSRTEFEGSGLGLSIAKRIAENHNGTITAESQPGKGATFVITLPQ